MKSCLKKSSGISSSSFSKSETFTLDRLFIKTAKMNLTELCLDVSWHVSIQNTTNNDFDWSSAISPDILQASFFFTSKYHIMQHQVLFRWNLKNIKSEWCENFLSLFFLFFLFLILFTPQSQRVSMLDLKSGDRVPAHSQCQKKKKSMFNKMSLNANTQSPHFFLLNNNSITRRKWNWTLNWYLCMMFLSNFSFEIISKFKLLIRQNNDNNHVIE